MKTILKISGFMNNAFTHLLAGLEMDRLAVFIDSHVDVVDSLPEVCTSVLDEPFDSNDRQRRNKLEVAFSLPEVFVILVEHMGGECNFPYSYHSRTRVQLS